MSKKQSENRLVKKFWDSFLTDKFIEANNVATELRSESKTQSEIDLATTMQAKILLRQGQFKLAYQVMQDHKSYSAFKLFLDFLVNGNPLALLQTTASDVESLLYRAQCLSICRLYWGDDYLKQNHINYNPDELIEKVFDTYIQEEEYDKAILAAIQTIEISLEDNLLSHDIQLPVIDTYLENLLTLSSKAKFDSTRARINLLKAKLFKDKDAAEMAEILFGKEQNHNGLGEVYLFYAKDCNEFEYFEKSAREFNKCNNKLAQGFIYESLASIALTSGEISEANELFKKAEELLNTGGCFEHYGLEIQRISLLAIRGKYQKVKESIHSLLNSEPPNFFLAQAYQILGNTLVQLGEDMGSAKNYIAMSCDIFKKLKRYNQLIHTQNIYFQLLLLDDDLGKIDKVGQEIIQLATRLGNEEIKASKYLDLAFVTIRVSVEDGSLNEEKLDQVSNYFKKAITLFQSQGNIVGEADTYQAMGNMFTGIGKLEDALSSFLKAKKLYAQEKAYLQSAITDTLIGILMLNYVMLNEQTYPIAQRHLEQALVYFAKENLLDLLWKATFYLADLNQKYYLNNKDKEDTELYKNRAKSYFLEMLLAIQDYQEEAPNPFNNETNLVGITIDDAYNQAYRFFIGINDTQAAYKFRPHDNRN